MKVVLLAGGYGTRFGKATDFLPKPMIPIGPMPILWHIMRYYACFGHQEFIIATGYKSELIKEFFCNLQLYANDFEIDLGRTNAVPTILSSSPIFKPKITIAYTGQDTMTGGRVKRIAKYLGDDEDFMLTYGDGLTNLDLDKLVEFHRSHSKIATLTAVYPPPKFGDLKFDGEKIVSFAEKEGAQGAMVNGGFYVFNRKVLDYLSDDAACVLEKAPMEKLAHEGQLMGYRHEGYWQCMDTTRDLENLQRTWEGGAAPWMKWNDGYRD